jgi:hypothetical protein
MPKKKKEEEKKDKKEDKEWELKVIAKIQKARKWLKEKEVVDKSPVEQIQEELEDPPQNGCNSKESKPSLKNGKKQKTEENLQDMPKSSEDFLDMGKEIVGDIVKETAKAFWKELLK